MAEPNYERQGEAADVDSQGRDGVPSREFPDHPRHEPSNADGASQPEPMGRLVDFIARINATVRVKLLGGFLLVVLLLLAMAILSFVVVAQMNQKVESLTQLQERVDLSRQLIYLVTAQSHFRTMALLTDDDSWNIKIAKPNRLFPYTWPQSKGPIHPCKKGFSVK